MRYQGEHQHQAMGGLKLRSGNKENQNPNQASQRPAGALFQPKLQLQPMTRMDEQPAQEQAESPQRVAAYQRDIFAYLLRTESAARETFDPNFMSMQSELTDRMRQILVDWLVDVQVKFNLKCETLFLAADFIDRYLSKKCIRRVEFQLLGVASLFIASKYACLSIDTRKYIRLK